MDGSNEDQLKKISATEEFGKKRDQNLADQERLFYEAGEKELELNRQNLGTLGSWFGSASNAPTNIAGVTIFVCMILLILTIICPNSQVEPKDLIGVITGTLGFVFGRATNSENNPPVAANKVSKKLPERQAKRGPKQVKN